RFAERDSDQPRDSDFEEDGATGACEAGARSDERYTECRGGSMIFDLRIYTLHNNKFGAWLKLYEEYGHPTQVKHCGEPVFYATTEVGPLNQVVHVWKYASQADREK